MGFFGGRGTGAVWYGFVLVGQQSGLGANGMMLENIDPFASNHPTNQPFLEMGNKEERLIFLKKLWGSLLLFSFSMKCSLKASLL